MCFKPARIKKLAGREEVILKYFLPQIEVGETVLGERCIEMLHVNGLEMRPKAVMEILVFAVDHNVVRRSNGKAQARPAHEQGKTERPNPGVA